MSLTKLILTHFDNESILKIREAYPSMAAIVDEEWANRLRDGDHLEILKFLSENEMKYTDVLIDAIYKAKSRIPWKVGVIYDYTTGNIASIQIKFGQKGNRNYIFNGKHVLFDWLDSTETGKIMREVVSDYPGDLSFQINKEDTDRIRDLFLNTGKVNVKVAKYTAIDEPFKSFPLQNSLSGGEDYLIKIVQIEDIIINDNEQLPENVAENVEYFNYTVPVNYYPDVDLYRKVLSTI